MAKAVAARETRAAVHEGVFIPDLIAGAFDHDLERTAMIFESGDSFTAGQLRDVVSTYIQALEEIGVGPGTRVGLLARNRPEVVYLLLALRVMAACTVTLHPMGAEDDHAYIIDDAAIDTLVFDADHYTGVADKLTARCPSLAQLMSFGGRPERDLTIRAARHSPGPLAPAQVHGEHLSRIAYSGGTTGVPKGIMLTERSQLATVSIQLSDWEWPEEIRHLVCAPLSHSGASVLTPVMIRGGALVVLPGFEPASVLSAIERYRITSMLVVPTMIYALLDHPDIHRYDLSSLQTVFYGASAISPTRLKEAIERFGPVFFQFYGQSEAPMSIALMRKQDHVNADLQRLASCGRPVPWLHTALLNDDGNEVPDGDPGEICVRGPLVCAGYLNKPELTDQAFDGGWLHTGDIAVRDPNGWWRIVDRKKDMIVTGGFNVYPREVEDVISTHPGVADVAVIGVPHHRWGESVKAVVVRRPGHDVSEDEITALVRSKKGSVQVPKSVDFVSSIPLSGLGKPDKKQLRSQYA